MKALVVTRTGAFSPERAQAKHIPVLLIQGGIHAGEIDGKDAGFLALREALDGKYREGRSGARIVWIFVPVRSTSTATSVSARGIARTSAARKKWAGARPRRISTSIATT